MPLFTPMMLMPHAVRCFRHAHAFSDMIIAELPLLFTARHADCDAPCRRRHAAMPAPAPPAPCLKPLFARRSDDSFADMPMPLRR